MRYFLGIDGGGTKTAALILDETNTPLGRGSGGSGNLATGSDESLRSSLREAVDAALTATNLPLSTRFAGVCAGMAGYSATPRVAAFQKILEEEVSAENYQVEPDYVTAYWGATEGNEGIIVIAGTGAVSYGRNKQGETRKEDGLGFVLGDKGSGFNLAVRVLRHALDSMDGGKTDALTDAVFKATQATSQNEIIQWLYGDFNPARVASIASVVGDLAETGDPAARSHVVEMARRLRHGVRQIRHALWLPRDVSVYTLGGLWQLGSFFQSEFAYPEWQGEAGYVIEPEKIPGGRFHVKQPTRDAVFGAALLARQ